MASWFFRRRDLTRNEYETSIDFFSAFALLNFPLQLLSLLSVVSSSSGGVTHSMLDFASKSVPPALSSCIRFPSLISRRDFTPDPCRHFQSCVDQVVLEITSASGAPVSRLQAFDAMARFDDVQKSVEYLSKPQLEATHQSRGPVLRIVDHVMSSFCVPGEEAFEESFFSSSQTSPEEYVSLLRQGRVIEFLRGRGDVIMSEDCCSCGLPRDEAEYIRRIRAFVIHRSIRKASYIGCQTGTKALFAYLLYFDAWSLIRFAEDFSFEEICSSVGPELYTEEIHVFWRLQVAIALRKLADCLCYLRAFPAALVCAKKAFVTANEIGYTISRARNFSVLAKAQFLSGDREGAKRTIEAAEGDVYIPASIQSIILQRFGRGDDPQNEPEFRCVEVSHLSRDENWRFFHSKTQRPTTPGFAKMYSLADIEEGKVPAEIELVEWRPVAPLFVSSDLSIVLERVEFALQCSDCRVLITCSSPDGTRITLRAF